MNAAMQLRGFSVGGGRRIAYRAAAVLLILGVVAGGAVLMPQRPLLSGRYLGIDGRSELEFRGSRVFVTSTLGTTFVADYEVDGDRVIIKGAGGAQVYTRRGESLDGGVGIKFTRQTDRGQAAADVGTNQEVK